MTLRIEKGPLEPWKRQAILTHYNRLTSSRIPMEEFAHWITDSPEGPAWHAMLESEDRRIVGHCAVLPLRGLYNGSRILAGKAEYAFILEEYQSAKIRGFENLSKPRNAIMTRQLFEHCRAAGFGLIFVSTNAAGQRSLWSVGVSTIEIPVRECLLVLHPWRASRSTPNLQTAQRAALFCAGVFQKGVWSLAGLFGKKAGSIQMQSVGNAPPTSDSHRRISFFDDSTSQSWRFGSQEYAQLTTSSAAGDHVILKNGSSDRYLRVCAWHLRRKRVSFTLISRLVELARQQNAMGVRWAVYGDENHAFTLASQIRNFGFLCAARTRKLLVYSENRDLLSADNWKLDDTMFSFDP